MIFDTSNIEKLKSVENIGNNLLKITYFLNDGSENITIVDSKIPEYVMTRLGKRLDNLDDLLTIKPVLNPSTREVSSILTCSTFNQILAEFIQDMYRYIEHKRASVYLNANNNNGVLDSKGMEHIKQFEDLVSNILKANKELISPVWRGLNSDLGIKYSGPSPEGIYSTNTEKYSPSKIIEYSIACGVENFSDVYAYGSYGGILPDALIESIYGKEAVEIFKNYSIESIKAHQYVESLHTNRN